MHDVAFQVSHFTGNYDVSMNFALDPTAMIAPEKPGLIIRIDTGVTHPTPKDMVLPGQAESIDGLAGRERRFNLLARAGFQSFIGIDLKHPFVFALWRSPVLLPGGVKVLMLDDARTVFTTNLKGTVSAKGINDQNFVGPLY
jgi:hypothetical protein